jgi:hypothetical protein
MVYISFSSPLSLKDLFKIRIQFKLTLFYCNLIFLDYISQRLKLDPGTLELGIWLERNLEPLKEIPRYLIPSYFDVVVTGTYLILLDQVWRLMSEWVLHPTNYHDCKINSQQQHFISFFLMVKTSTAKWGMTSCLSCLYLDVIL